MFNRNYLGWRMLRDAQLADERYEQRTYAAHMRTKLDPLRYKSDRKFIKLYRLTKESFMHLCDLLGQHTELRSTQRVSLEEKVSEIKLVGTFSPIITNDDLCSMFVDQFSNTLRVINYVTLQVSDSILLI